MAPPPPAGEPRDHARPLPCSAPRVGLALAPLDGAATSLLSMAAHLLPRGSRQPGSSSAAAAGSPAGLLRAASGRRPRGHPDRPRSSLPSGTHELVPMHRQRYRLNLSAGTKSAMHQCHRVVARPGAYGTNISVDTKIW